MKNTVVLMTPTAMRWINIAGVLFLLLLGLVEPSFAGAGGFDKVETNTNNVSTLLKTIAVVIVTIAIMIAGFKIAFSGARFQDVWGILLGGTLIGGASGLAGWIATPDE